MTGFATETGRFGTSLPPIVKIRSSISVTALAAKTGLNFFGVSGSIGLVLFFGGEIVLPQGPPVKLVVDVSRRLHLVGTKEVQQLSHLTVEGAANVEVPFPHFTRPDAGGSLREIIRLLRGKQIRTVGGELECKVGLK